MRYLSCFIILMDWRFFCIVSQSNYSALWRVRIWTMHCYHRILTGIFRWHDWNDITDSSDILSVMRKSPLTEYWIFVYIYRSMNIFHNMSVYTEMKKTTRYVFRRNTMANYLTSMVKYEYAIEQLSDKTLLVASRSQAERQVVSD